MKPILFNTDMVRAIQEGRKSVTRRAVRTPGDVHELFPVHSKDSIVWRSNGTDVWFEIASRYHTGDILYVRETWTKNWYVDPDGYTHYDQPMYYYAADGTPDITLMDDNGFTLDDQRIRWRPSIHMPKEAARLFLRVTDVRVERLQDINDDGVVAEGLEIGDPFDELWDSTIKPADRDRYGWDANPWVWVFKFERISKEDKDKP